jgi:hypothetical protein
MEGAGISIKAPEGYQPREFEETEDSAADLQAQQAEIPANEEQSGEPAKEQETPEPVAQETAPQPKFEDIFRERIGMTPEEVAAIVDEYGALKKRKFIEDEELVATSDLEKDFLRYSKRGGDVKAFVNSVFTDYAKMSDEEIIKHDILSEDPSMPKALLERKYKAKLVEFGWSEELEPDDREYNEVLAYQTSKLRTKHIQEAQKYKVPEKAEAPQGRTNDTALQEQYQREFMESEPVKNLQLSKKVSFGDFDYAVEPSEIISLLSDPNKLALKFTKPDGSSDISKMIKWYALADDPDAPIKAAADAAVKRERLESIKRDVNPAPIAPAAPVGASPVLKWGVSK